MWEAGVVVTAAARPSGTVSFLFTDVEDSTRLWEQATEAMAAALERHDEILRMAIADHGGYVFSTAGDAFAAAFQGHSDAVAAAIVAQEHLAAEPWPDPAVIRVRMGIHTGSAQERDGDYFGPALNLAGRLMSAGHGGQILLSAATSELMGGQTTTSLGVHRLKDLSSPQEIFDVTPSGLTRSFPPLRTLDVHAHNLPIVGDDLVGRENDRELVDQLLGRERLITVVGVGGIGKTRFALDVAAGNLHDYPDGVWLCQLAPIGDAEMVADAVADVLGTRQHPGQSMVDSVATFCSRRELLLVLDNCEHVLDAAADLAEAIASVAPEARILATSREALGSPGEVTYPLRSLAVGGASNPAIELFLRRAAAVAPDRSWTDAESAAIEAICRRLDGIPLAIELAATAIRSQTPVEIKARLDDAFRSLRGGRRSLERHRTLEATIDWSYASLTESARVLFERLAVFAGSGDLAAIEAICSDNHLPAGQILGVLDDLVAKSLVIAEPAADASTRYRLLEPLRQYTEDRLHHAGVAARLHDAHLAHYTAWVEAWDVALDGPATALQVALDLEFPNARSAVLWAVTTGDADRACRIVVALRSAQESWRRLEVGAWAARVLEMDGAEAHPLAPEVAGVCGVGCWWRNALDEWDDVVERAQRLEHFDLRRPWHAVVLSSYATLRKGDVAEGNSLMDGTEARSTKEQVLKAWVGVQNRHGSEASRRAMAALDDLVAHTGSVLIELRTGAARGLFDLPEDFEGSLAGVAAHRADRPSDRRDHVGPLAPVLARARRRRTGRRRAR